ncbi:DUF5777 family beta-barrel protein [Lewinella cohaerens]|uniref:DUF5777 family beta-barrel protein n=1 Tax=Lewinella cohaerens TaxID=70995 RepID=UPI00036857F1|nr:DUF5777 family beta-barrel protein [Lewinella cohaerens]
MTQNGTMGPLFILAFMILLGNTPLTAQDQVYRTFKDSRVVNIHSPETLPKGRLDIRISHRFGDIGGDNGGFATFYGLETASDVSIGGEYGVTDGLTVGLYRSKGAGVSVEGFPGLRQLLNGVGKLRLTKQEENGGAPLSATVMGMVSLSTQEKLEGAGNEASIASFPNFNHRIASHIQLILARKFSDGFSLQVSPGYTHRNLVPFEDKNGMFSISTGGRVQVTRTFGLLADAVFPLIDSRKSGTGYFPAIGVGFEFETSGHIFQVNLTNATALMETDFIPYTTTDWTEGQFRLGFTISRWFNL